MVTTSLSLTELTGIRQERNATLSTSTVQQPQCPSPQPYLGPVSPSSVRNTQSNRRSPSTFKRAGLPLSLKEIVSAMSASSWKTFSFLRCLVVLRPLHRLLYPFVPECQSRIIGDLLTGLTHGL